MAPVSVCWPSFYIVGAVKCGTTSLYMNLKKHPQVFMPEIKEPGFFAHSLNPVPRNLEKLYCPGDLTEYQRLYEGCSNYRAVGDASPSYLWDEDAARRIYAANPQARIIIMLRDPVERAYSHYLMKIHEGVEQRPFMEALKKDYAKVPKDWWKSGLYVDLGLYYEAVKRYLEIFGREQVRIFCFEEFTRNPEAVLSRIASHIGVDPELIDLSETREVHNPYRRARLRLLLRAGKFVFNRRLRHFLIPASIRKKLASSPLLFNMKKPPQTPDTRLFLQQIYAADLDRLEDLLEQELPDLRKSWTPASVEA